MHAYKTYSEYGIYKSTNVPVLKNARLLAISISTGYEPSYRYSLKSHDLSYDLFHDFQKSLKNPKPRHHSNNRINRTKTQHHQEPSPRSHDDFLNTPPQGLPSSPNVAAIVARVKAEDVVDAVDTVDAEKAVKAQIATEIGNRVSAPMAKLSAIPQMHAGNENTLQREKTAEEVMSAFATSADSQTISKSIVSPRNVYGSGGE